MSERVITSTHSQVKPNGNMLVGPENRLKIKEAIWIELHGIRIMNSALVTLTASKKRSQTRHQINGNYSICMGMSGNGVKISFTRITVMRPRTAGPGRVKK